MTAKIDSKSMVSAIAYGMLRRALEAKTLQDRAVLFLELAGYLGVSDQVGHSIEEQAACLNKEAKQLEKDLAAALQDKEAYREENRALRQMMSGLR